MRTFEVGHSSKQMPSPAAHRMTSSESTARIPWPMRRTPSRSTASRTCERGASLGRVRRETQAGGSGDGEGAPHRLERREEELVTGDVETDDAAARVRRRRSGHGLVRLAS